VQASPGAVLVHTLHALLEGVEISFNGVDVDFATAIPTLTVPHETMLKLAAGGGTGRPRRSQLSPRSDGISQDLHHSASTLNLWV